MLKNLWYVVEQSDRVGTAPVRSRLLGQDLVVFRDGGGTARVLSDICIHRGGSLAGGLVVDGSVECPYHGWRFAGDGRCTRIPAQPDAKIPERARVDAYPTIERWGWIWAFLGDLPEAERPPLPDLAWIDDPGLRIMRGRFDWKANWERVCENGLDFAHAPFVHGTAFGDRNRPEMNEFVVESHAWGGGATMVMHPPPMKGFWAAVGGKRQPVSAIPGFHFSGPCVTLMLRPRGNWSINLVSAHTPVDEDNTRTWWIMGRNFMKSRFFDRDSERRNVRIFEQDRVVLEKIRPERVPDTWREEVTVKSDALQVAFRRKLRELEGRGWKIDSRRIDEQYRGRKACTVPCPARRESAAWVIDPVPTLAGGAESPGESAP